MQPIRLSLAALALVALGPPAGAQTATPFENTAMATVASCFATAVTVETAAQAITACEKTITDMSALKVQNPAITGHDLNVYLIVNSMAETRIGNSYATLDSNVRTPRVCVRMERSWALVSQLQPAASPSYVATIAKLRDSSIAVIRKCREENGTPQGAPPLP
jgi:hypothetical protein